MRRRRYSLWRACPLCCGAGSYYRRGVSHACEECDGTGYVEGWAGRPGPRRPLEVAAAVVLGLVASAACCGLLSGLDACVRLAWGLEGPPTGVAVSRLAPHLSAERARELADAIDDAARPHALDPVLVASIAARESSFRPEVLDGRVRGRLGETGILQVVPGGVALRWAPDGCSQSEVACSLATGCGYLAWLRDEGCPGSTWRWVAAYGRRRCPSEDEAREGRAVRRAFELYRRAGGEGWPR